MELRDAVAVGGLVFGTVGATLGLINLYRDRPRLKVVLRWDLAAMQKIQDPSVYWGTISRHERWPKACTFREGRHHL